MREYNLHIKEMLTHGLRSSDRTGRGSPFLTECKFVKSMEEGLRSGLDITRPFASAKYNTFPFPQLLRGKAITLLANESSIEEVDESGSSWSTSDINTYDAYNETTRRDIEAGGVWHMVDFFDTWFLLNGECVVYKTHHIGMVAGESDRVFVLDEVEINTGCASRGRVLFGGFNPEAYWTDAWKTIWDGYAAAFNFNIDNDMPIGKNFVMWSTIGGGDVLNLFHADKATDGLISSDTSRSTADALFMDYYKRNEAGLLPLPWQGTVQVLKPLGKGVMAYSESGSGLFMPVMEPIPTYSFQKILDIGVPDRGAVGGDENIHIFIDTGGKLWTISTDYAPKLLDYSEFLIPLLGQPIVISYGSQMNTFYISGKDEDNNNYTYTLTKNGLSRTPQHITSTCFADGALLGVFKTPISTEVVVVTDILDFDIRDLKLITTVELGIEVEEGAEVYVAVDYKYAKDLGFTRSDWVPVNREGFARVQKAGIEFRLCIKCSTYIDLKIDYANVKWQLIGKRTIRGAYGTETRV